MAISNAPPSWWQKLVGWIAPPHVRETAEALKKAKADDRKKEEKTSVKNSPVFTQAQACEVIKYKSPHEKLLEDVEARLQVYAYRLGWQPVKVFAYVAKSGMVVSRSSGPEGQEVCRVIYRQSIWLQKGQKAEDKTFIREFTGWENRQQVIDDLFTPVNAAIAAKPFMPQTWQFEVTKAS